MAGKQVEYRDRLLRIAELTVTTTLIEEVLAVNCAIDGPAVLVIVDAARFDHCDFDAGGADIDAMFIEMPEGSSATGVVGLRAVAFESCRFTRVAFMGTKETLDRIRAGIKH